MGCPGSYNNVTYMPATAAFTYSRCLGGSTSYSDTMISSKPDLTGISEYSGKVSYITGTRVHYGAGGGTTPTAPPIPSS
jgi:hypothetical protein